MSTQEQAMPVKRDYKPRMFKLIFDDKRKLLELYNAVSGKNYTNPEQLTINTLENAIYMSMQNDLSFIIDSRLSLYEHQSTYNPNMALRFVVFYNGRDKRPDYDVLKLSDLYMVKDERLSLELTVDMININKGHNSKLMEACKDLGILKDFLEKHRAEARAMSIYEYNEEEHMRMEREDAFEDGRKAGLGDGQKIGQEKILSLISKMTADGMADQIPRLSTEPAFYEEMIRKYNL